MLATALALALCAAMAAPAPVEVFVLDDDATGYATFQSHNQKVVANSHGIFTTHIRTRNEAYDAQQWRLSHTRDRGETFETLYEATDATNPPVIETDAAGNLYLFRVDFKDGNGYLYRFTAADDFRNPAISTVPGAAAGKYAMTIDEARGVLYVFSHNNTFHVINLDGAVRSSTTLLQEGHDAYLQYPHLAVDADGNLHAPWTTQQKDKYLYWDIHHMLSPDGGTTWRTMDGQTLTLPVVADQHGPATRITLPDENETHTWLSSVMPKGGKVHFFYLNQSSPPREHYVRYDAATGSRDIDTDSRFNGETLEIMSLDGFFATRDLSADSSLYAIGSYQGRIVCLISRDNGARWHDFAVSDAANNPYAVGGARSITPDGYIVGTFTYTPPDPAKPIVYFFRIKAE